jgi:hypothetical protein
MLGNPATGGAAESGAVSAPADTEPDLARVVAAWPRLPEQVRAAVLALVATAARQG